MDTKALRQKILDLAIRGKLVPQDPNDEPASVLLGRIRQQKQQMVKEGKLKPKDIKNDSVIFVGEDNLHYEKFADDSVKCIEDEIPFELPDGWAWERLSNLASFSGGKTPSTSRSEYWDGDILWVTSKDMKSKYITSSQLRLSTLGAEQMQMYQPDTLLLVTRSGILRHTLPVAILKECATINQDLKAIILYMPQLAEYIYVCLKGMETQLLLKYTKSGTTVENVNFDEFQKVLLPIPPIQQIDRIMSSTGSAESVVSTIEDDKAALADYVIKAKSKILDLAIRGQLVPQDPDDEPASVLLERIRAEKEELIKQGKIKRDKKESVIFRGEDNSYYVRQDTHTESIDEQFIFELPDNWEWCSLLNIAKIELGKTLDSAKNIGINYPYLRSVNVRWNEVDLSDLKAMRFEPEELDRYTVRQNDLLICEGGDVGRSCVWTDEKEILYQNALHKVRFYGGCNPFYFMYYMMYYESRGIIKALCKGVTIKHLTGNVLSLIPFALPPLEEQNLIVERLNRIFVLLDSIICD
jgi:type I restriction enzyme S subunit